jgi:hypothetical protein
MDKKTKARVKRVKQNIERMKAQLQDAGVSVNENPMLTRIRQALYRTWQNVASDTLVLCNKPSLSRVETYDAVIDYVDRDGKDPEAVRWWFEQTPKARKQWLPTVMPYERYGV